MPKSALVEQLNGRARDSRGRLKRYQELLERQLFRSAWPAHLGAAMGMPLAPQIVRHSIQLGDTDPSGRTLRIAYASDFHAGPTTHPALLAEACAMLRTLQPDVLLLGGDFVSYEASHAETLVGLLAEVPAPLGRYAVLGNHDWWSSPDRLVDLLTGAGVDVLINRNVRLPAPFDPVWICGIDDPWAGHPDAETALEGADGIRLVLMHSPSNLVDIGQRRFDLALCGHTHGGQICLPRGTPLVKPHGPLCRSYLRGRFDLDSGGVLIVSVGVGCASLPFRVGARSEILLCELSW